MNSSHLPLHRGGYDSCFQKILCNVSVGLYTPQALIKAGFSLLLCSCFPLKFLYLSLLVDFLPAVLEINSLEQK